MGNGARQVAQERRSFHQPGSRGSTRAGEEYVDLLDRSPHPSLVPRDDCHAVFGPLGRRILNLQASPSGHGIAFQHVPEHYSTDDYHEVVYRRSGETYVEVGEFPMPPALSSPYRGTMQRTVFAPLDDGQCLALEVEPGGVDWARYAPAAGGLEQVARRTLHGTYSQSEATLRLLPGGREAVVHISDRDDKNADWGGGPLPDYPQTYLLVDLASGTTIEEYSFVRDSWDEALISLPGFSNAGRLAKKPAPAWLGTRDADQTETLEKLIKSLSWDRDDSARRVGSKWLLTRLQVIDMTTGETVLQLADDDPGRAGFRVAPRFHDISLNENYILSTMADGSFALWNVSAKNSWQPELPEHGGVHTAVFLPQARAALGTARAGVIVVDCKPGVSPGDKPW